MEKVTNDRELKDLSKTGDWMVYFHDEVLGNVMYLHFMNFSDDIF